MTSISKLGQAYDMEQIKSLDKIYHNTLRKLKRIGENKYCADCGTKYPSWCSVNIGVFLCVNCAQIHRAIGTHISKLKSCEGSYLWYPDEMERVEQLGNKCAQEYYQQGAVVDHQTMSRDKIIWMITKKYQSRPIQELKPPKVTTSEKDNTNNSLIDFEDW